jgi:hypothetical protein
VEGYVGNADPLDEIVVDADDIARTAVTIMNGRPHELRVIGEAIFSGVYATPDKLAAAARVADGTGNVYIGLNPTSVGPHPMHRAHGGEGVSDAQIERVEWLGVDVDPVDDEDVLPVAAEINEFLVTEIGFPEAGLFASSGRGVWLLWPLDQENNARAADRRWRFLLGLKARWPQVDSSTYNASRIARCFGTVNLKNGARSAVYRVVETEPVPDALLERVAVPEYERPDRGVRGSVELILERLAERGIEVSHERRLELGTAMQLSACPFYPGKNHATAAALYAWNDGNVGFRCLGDACTAEDNRILRLAELLDIELIATKVDGKIAWASASEIKPTTVDTAWDGRIVLHGLNLQVGDEGAGKGLLAVRLSADLSTGRLGRPITVAYASTEEVVAAVVVPRLRAAGADLDRVVVAPMGSLGLPEALPQVLEQLSLAGATWLFLDPVNAHFSSGLDPNRTKDVNMVLNALARAAAEHRLTIVGNLHTNRGGGVSPRDRYAHQSEFRRVTRSSVIIGQSPDDGPDERTVVHDKHSYTAPAPSLSARIEVVDGVATLALGAETDVTAEELFLRDADKDAALRRVRGESGKTAECAEEIMDRWRAIGSPGTASSSEFSQIAATYGPMGVQRARSRLGITVDRETDPESGKVTSWSWRFPA